MLIYNVHYTVYGVHTLHCTLYGVDNLQGEKQMYVERTVYSRHTFVFHPEGCLCIKIDDKETR